MHQEVAFFDKTKTGELVNRLSTDTSVVGQSVTTNISDGLRSLTQAGIGLGMMVRFSNESFHRLVSGCLFDGITSPCLLGRGRDTTQVGYLWKVKLFRDGPTTFSRNFNVFELVQTGSQKTPETFTNVGIFPFGQTNICF